MLVKIIVCLFAGLGAGFGTGFAGMSAAAVISPMLITFLGVPAYQRYRDDGRCLNLHPDWKLHLLPGSQSRHGERIRLPHHASGH